jgi:Zn-dependent alcohol dehydrogenase
MRANNAPLVIQEVNGAPDRMRKGEAARQVIVFD